MPQEIYPVDLIISHIAMHEDELCAITIGQRWDGKLLPGFAQAPIRLIDAGLHLEIGHDGDYYLKHKRTACIGVLGGWCDEHAQFHDGVRWNAATKMADYLGVSKDPGLVPILEYSLRADRDAGDSPFEWASIIKSFWTAGVSLERVLLLYRTVFDALYQRGAGTAHHPVPSNGFHQLMDEWFIKSFGRNEKGFPARPANTEEVVQILKFQTRNGQFKDKRPFDLESIWEALVAAGVEQDRIRIIVFTCLDSKYAEQCRFMAAIDEFREHAAYLTPNRVPYRVAVIKSDNDQAKRAAKWVDLDLDVLIQFRSDGHVNVFDLCQRLNMDPVNAQLRILELARKGYYGPRLPMQVLLAKGTLKAVREWFNFFGANNGTLTAPNTPVTKLTEEEIIGCTAAGLVRAYRDKPVESRKRLRERMERKRAEKEARRVAQQQTVQQ